MIEQTKVHFPSNRVTLVGYLYHPAGNGTPRPGVVLANGFTGTQDTPSIQAAAREFAAAGFTALTFDYRNFGESDGQPRQLLSIEGQHQDLYAAIRFARKQTSIDSGWIALWGTSLGGGHVIAVAADDPQIAAVVAQVPFNAFPERVDGRSSAATLRLLGVTLNDAIRGWLGLTHHYIRAVGATGELAIMASPQAQQTIATMQSSQWRNQVAPRVLLEMMRYKPGDQAFQLNVPVMVSIAENDSETPPDLARQIAEIAPRGEFKSYPISHFEIYRPDVRALVLRDQIDFLRKYVLGSMP